MGNLDNRTRLLRQIRGENLDNSVKYTIEYFVDIRGGLTIWAGMDYLRGEETPFDSKKRVSRHLMAVNENQGLSPYTKRIYQIEEEKDREISDEVLIREYLKFREQFPTDGFGKRLLLLNLGVLESGEKGLTDSEGRELKSERPDGEILRSRLWEQERQDILNLFGVEVPEDLNSESEYMNRLSGDKGVSSSWFSYEFKRIGGGL